MTKVNAAHLLDAVEGGATAAAKKRTAASKTAQRKKVAAAKASKAAAGKAADRPRTAAGKAKVAVTRASRESAAARRRAKSTEETRPSFPSPRRRPNTLSHFLGHLETDAPRRRHNPAPAHRTPHHPPRTYTSLVALRSPCPPSRITSPPTSPLSTTHPPTAKAPARVLSRVAELLLDPQEAVVLRDRSDRLIEPVLICPR